VARLRLTPSTAIPVLPFYVSIECYRETFIFSDGSLPEAKMTIYSHLVPGTEIVEPNVHSIILFNVVCLLTDRERKREREIFAWRCAQLSTYLQNFLLTCLIHSFIHSFSILSDDRSKTSSKTIPPHSEIYRFLFQMRVSSPVLKVIQ
jgi:hypothetical protein